jgi:hypothetical protein
MVSALFFAGVTEPATLEPLACRDALALAKDLALVKVYVASVIVRRRFQKLEKGVWENMDQSF